jgi:hypothetical protein
MLAKKYFGLVLSNVFIYWVAVEARAPCGDCNNNNRVILIKITTDFIFYDTISSNILKFTQNNFYL